MKNIRKLYTVAAIAALTLASSAIGAQHSAKVTQSIKLGKPNAQEVVRSETKRVYRQHSTQVREQSKENSERTGVAQIGNGQETRLRSGQSSFGVRSGRL